MKFWCIPKISAKFCKFHANCLVPIEILCNIDHFSQIPRNIHGHQHRTHGIPIDISIIYHPALIVMDFRHCPTRSSCKLVDWYFQVFFLVFSSRMALTTRCWEIWCPCSGITTTAVPCPTITNGWTPRSSQSRGSNSTNSLDFFYGSTSNNGYKFNGHHSGSWAQHLLHLSILNTLLYSI